MNSITRKILSVAAVAAAASVAVVPALLAAPPADNPPAAAPMMDRSGMSMGAHAMPGKGGPMPDMMQHDGNMDDMMQQHHQMMSRMQQMHGNAPSLPGQDAFGAIQEIVRTLEADPRTDWAKVDLEALRQHLIDMNDVTLQANAAAKPIDGGLEITVTGADRTLAAIQRMIPAHAAEINGLNGWSAKTQAIGNGVVLTVTATDPKEVQHIRGLGFIGILVSGSHHQPHHLAMAKGEFPHAH
jgi:hypothetical protein